MPLNPTNQPTFRVPGNNNNVGLKFLFITVTIVNIIKNSLPFRIQVIIPLYYTNYSLFFSE